MKKLFFITTIVSSLFFATNCLASFFPNDATTVSYDSVYDSATSGTLLSAVNYDRTILNVSITCDTDTPHAYIYAGNTPTTSNVLVRCNIYHPWSSNDLSYLLPANTPIKYDKQYTLDICNFMVTFTDYNLSLFDRQNEVVKISSSSLPILVTSTTATSTFASTTPQIMENDIQNIGYHSTSTPTATGQIITDATFQIPIALYFFIFSIIILIIIVVTLLIYFKTQKNVS